MKNRTLFLAIIITLILFASGAILINSRPKLNRYSKIEDIIQEENKVNIYFFWGSGCPHCEQEFNFFETIDKEYKKQFNLYAFEVYQSEENVDFMLSLADKLGDEVTGIPYTIIGEKSFTGFGKGREIDMKEAIKEQINNNKDIYLN